MNTRETIVNLTNREISSTLGAMLCTAAYQLIAWARAHGVDGLPITVAQIESDCLADEQYTNHEYERTANGVLDLVRTVERRLPGTTELHLTTGFAPGAYVEIYTTEGE